MRLRACLLTHWAKKAAVAAAIATATVCLLALTRPLMTVEGGKSQKILHSLLHLHVKTIIITAKKDKKRRRRSLWFPTLDGFFLESKWHFLYL